MPPPVAGCWSALGNAVLRLTVAFTSTASPVDCTSIPPPRPAVSAPPPVALKLTVDCTTSAARGGDATASERREVVGDGGAAQRELGVSRHAEAAAEAGVLRLSATPRRR